MYKVYSNGGEKIILPFNINPDGNGWVFECETSEADFLKIHYESDIDSALSRILDLEQQQDRPLREIAVAQVTGASSDFARDKLIQIDDEIKALRTQINEARIKLGGLNGN